MDPSHLKELLERVRSGAVSIERAAHELKKLPFEDLGFARVDHHRALRQGVPEVIFSEGKSVEHVVGVCKAVIERRQNVIVTRLDRALAEEVCRTVPELEYIPAARLASHAAGPIRARTDRVVPVVTAGTSDIPVAEEACHTLRLCGISVDRIFDVGVAGLHRVVGELDKLSGAPAIIVVAGMEGAMASVLGGLVAPPIVAVPTSVGYGVAQQGMTALFGMLTSCASGVTVVNIDNGFGAAMAVVRIIGPGPDGG